MWNNIWTGFNEEWYDDHIHSNGQYGFNYKLYYWFWRWYDITPIYEHHLSTRLSECITHLLHMVKRNTDDYIHDYCCSLVWQSIVQCKHTKANLYTDNDIYVICRICSRCRKLWRPKRIRAADQCNDVSNLFTLHLTNDCNHQSY